MIKRYSVVTVVPQDDRAPYGMMVEDHLGKYVSYDDYLKLQSLKQAEMLDLTPAGPGRALNDAQSKAFRWKHVPTGLYYIPSRDVRKTVKNANGKEVWLHTKSNLSKTGKIYAKNIRPPSGIYNHIAHIEQLKKTTIDDPWQIRGRPVYQQTTALDWVKEPC